MSGITGLGTTFNLPNYHGMLFGASPADTPLLSAIGGLTPAGDQIVQDIEFQWTYYDLRDATQSRVRTEGQDAPTAEERVRGTLKNVCQIHQEAVSVSYTKLAAKQRLSGLNSGGQSNVVTDESAWQIEQQLKQVARDVEFSFLRGTYQLPSDNATARQTRGLIPAATAGLTVNGVAQANVVTASDAGKSFTSAASTDLLTASAHGYSNGDQVVLSGLTGSDGVVADVPYFVVNSSTNTFKLAATYGGSAIDITVDGSGTVAKLNDLSKANVDTLLQSVWDNGGIREQETATLVCNSWNKRRLSKVLITDANYREQTRNVGGVAVTTIETDFGTLNIMLDRYMPQHKVLVASLEQVRPKFLLVPDKGVLFVEPLAKVGAQEKAQLYGEIGLEYGNPLAHGVITGTTVR